MRNYQQLEYTAVFDEALKIVKSWLDAKPDNEELKTLSSALITIATYNAGLEIERKGYDSSYDRLVTKYKKAIEKVKELKALIPTEDEKKFEAMTTGDNDAINSIL